MHHLGSGGCTCLGSSSTFCCCFMPLHGCGSGLEPRGCGIFCRQPAVKLGQQYTADYCLPHCVSTSGKLSVARVFAQVDAQAFANADIRISIYHQWFTILKPLIACLPGYEIAIHLASSEVLLPCNLCLGGSHAPLYPSRTVPNFETRQAPSKILGLMWLVRRYEDMEDMAVGQYPGTQAVTSICSGCSPTHGYLVGLLTQLARSKLWVHS